MDRVRKLNISESYTPSSESYSNYLYITVGYLSYEAVMKTANMGIVRGPARNVVRSTVNAEHSSA
jgi:hypothetical protein